MFCGDFQTVKPRMLACSSGRSLWSRCTKKVFPSDTLSPTCSESSDTPEGIPPLLPIIAKSMHSVGTPLYWKSVVCTVLINCTCQTIYWQCENWQQGKAYINYVSLTTALHREALNVIDFAIKVHRLCVFHYSIRAMYNSFNTKKMAVEIFPDYSLDYGPNLRYLM